MAGLLPEGADSLRIRVGGGVGVGTGGGVGAFGGDHVTIPAAGSGRSPGRRTGNSNAAVRATAWAAIDKGRTVARLPKRPAAGGADTTRSSNILPFICVASVY